MILSILIPTVKRRKRLLDSLVWELQRQMQGKAVEIIIDEDERKTTGEKRNRLKARAQGEYIIFIDDDDQIYHEYISEILKGCESGSDVVVFNGYMTTNGKNRVNFVIRLGETYEMRNGIYYRYPNHLCAFKRSLVKDIHFPNVSKREDFIWSTKVKDSDVLKTQYIIEKDLYHYRFLTHKY